MSIYARRKKVGQNKRPEKSNAQSYGKIETTVTRAKEVAAMAEKMITIGKTGDLHSKRQILAYVTKEDVAKKLVDEIAPKYADRNGGYTKIIKVGPRRGDAAEMAIIQLV